MGRKIKIMKTILALIFTIIFLIGFHTYNYLEIQSLKFSDKWGRGIEVGKAFVNREPIIGTYKDKLLIATFNKEGRLLCYLISKTGKVLESNLSNEDININRIKNIYLFENKLFYVKDNKLKLSYYNEETGFTESVKLLDNIKGFTLSKIQDELYIGTYGDKNIDIYKFENDELKRIYEMNNKWNVRNIYLKEVNGGKYVFIADKADLNVNDILLVRFDKLDNEAKKIMNIKSGFNDVIKDIKIEIVDNKIFFAYLVTNTKSRSRTYLELKVLNAETFNLEVSKKITDSYINGVAALGRNSISVYKENGKIKIICSGINMRNKYAMYSDIFELEVDKQGNILNVIFISNTGGQSKRPSFIRTEFGDYLAWLDIEVNGYKLFVNSKNKDFISENNIYTKNDYITAFYRALASPFYALAFGFLKGMESFLYVLIVFLPVDFILRKYRIDKENIKFKIFLSLYIVLNLLLFRSTFYSGYTVFFLPSYLKFKFAPYIMPLVLNLISGAIIYIFYKDNKKLSYISFLIFFIAVNIYLSSLLYVPFAMTKIILK
ncbi:hypothetical protein SAMN02745135_00689 [Caloranaerobacter azorensis DSM 13643]|uniref:Uncharacterized protein n=1 Tax=Caloranaerobacter azorensis DSM 13643 TaxID=1121264 RepID=A0A1M5SPK1_9FIRM|nr:hypothetical protein [Caloranaerobacter azorensis]SHH40474.1 hypothetical protein SAMN02745135_00689 [Caloranaerobacter azorensis DSM 13643]